MVARLLWEQDAAGSSPVTSTKKPRGSIRFPLVFLSKHFTDLKLAKRSFAKACGSKEKR